MTWSVSAFSVVILAGAVLALFVLSVALRNRPNPIAVPLAVLMLAVAAWAVPHAVSLGFSDVGRVAFWHRMRYPGTVLAPVAYLVLAVRYAGADAWLSRRTYALLGVVPAIAVLSVWTNPSHGLFWQSLDVTSVGGATVFAPTFGPVYWVNLAYLYLVTITGLFTLGRVALRSGPVYRKQATLMFLGGAVPLLTNGVVNFVLVEGTTVDFTTTTLAVTGLAFALATFHFDLLEIRPVARERLVEELDDGVVVVGPHERVRDFNPTAARILTDIELDQPASDVLPADVAADGGELVVELDGEERYFRTRSSPLTDERGERAGRIVYLNDVTELVRREQRISVLNRILRHNVRNELNVIGGRLELLAEDLSDRPREHVTVARESADRIAAFADKARAVERTIQSRESGSTLEVVPAVERVLEEVRAAFPEARVKFERPADSAVTTIRGVDPALFEMAVGELVENAIRHADAEAPLAAVEVTTDDDAVRISVADEGPVIPDQEKAALRTRVETDLEHGSGLGLWLVHWTAQLSGGSLSFAENDPTGNVVTVSFRAADP